MLLDSRGMKVTVDACDVSQVAARMVEMGVPALGLRFAVLCDEPASEGCRLIETSFRNNSMRIRLLPEEPEAVEWLTS